MATKYKLPGSNLVPTRYRKHYSRSLVLLGILLLALIGYKTNQHFQQQRNEVASRTFWELSSALEEQDAQALESSYGILQEQANEGQLVLAKLLLARAEVDEDDSEAAAQYYRDIVEISRHKSLKDIARMRLAKLLAAEQRYDEAWKMTEEIESEQIQYSALVAELQGDINVLQKKFDEAREKYEEAFELMQTLNEPEYGSFIQSKLAMVYSAQLEELLS